MSMMYNIIQLRRDDVSDSVLYALVEYTNAFELMNIYAYTKYINLPFTNYYYVILLYNSFICIYVDRFSHLGTYLRLSLIFKCHRLVVRSFSDRLYCIQITVLYNIANIISKYATTGHLIFECSKKWRVQ